MESMAKRWPLYTIFLLIILSSCRQEMHPLIPQEVRQTMKKSGKNSIEFMKVIVEYRQPQDSLKLHALYYLISHMKGHGLRTYLLQDSTGNYIDYNIMDYSSYDVLMTARDSITRRRGPLHFIRHYFGPDIYFARGKDLYAIVERSFERWENAPWAQGYSFETFCEKMLPYRTNDAYYDSVLLYNGPALIDFDTLKEGSAFQVARHIIRDLEDEMTFDKRFIENPTDRNSQGWKTFPGGRVEDKAAFLVTALRSAGIASAVDFVPHALESGEEAEYWVVIWNGKGEKRYFFPFSDSLAIPQEPVKIFRRSYKTYHFPLPDDSVFRMLKFHHLKTGKYKDVTSAYYPVTSWQLYPDEMEEINKLEPLFLTVKEKQHWLPVGWRYFTKKQSFRKLKYGEDYALMDAGGKILVRKSLPANISRSEQTFREQFSGEKPASRKSTLFRYTRNP